MNSIEKAAWFVAVALVLRPRLSWSDTVETQNTFEAGETARAAEVNENFTAVIDAIEGNDALIGDHEARIEDLEATDAVPGPQGETGLQGVPGSQGETGLQGETGPQGETGLRGVPGMDGLDGEQGETGPTGPPGASLRVFDALGNEIGWHVDGGSQNFRVYLDSVEARIHVTLDGTWVREPSQIFFEDLDCTGQAFVERRLVGKVVGDGDRLFIGREVPSSDPEYQSRIPGFVCYNDQASGPLTDAVPADEIFLEDLGLTFPLPAPLYVAPAPAP